MDRQLVVPIQQRDTSKTLGFINVHLVLPKAAKKNNNISS